MKVSLKRVEKGLYYFPGSKCLPELHISGFGSSWSVSNANEVDRYSREWIFENGFRSLKSVREWLAGYDARAIEAAHAEALEMDAELEYRLKKYKEEKELNESVNWDDDRELEVGSFIEGKFAHLNKNNEIGEYRFLCKLPEFDEEGKIWIHDSKNGWHWHTPKNWSVEKVKVLEVKELSVEEYDNFKVNLLSGYDFLGSNKGGHDCDMFDADWNYMTASEEEREMFRNNAYRVVVAVRAPGREIVLVDCSGYEYARYVGFMV